MSFRLTRTKNKFTLYNEVECVERFLSMLNSDSVANSFNSLELFMLEHEAYGSFHSLFARFCNTHVSLIRSKWIKLISENEWIKKNLTILRRCSHSIRAHISRFGWIRLHEATHVGIKLGDYRRHVAYWISTVIISIVKFF